MRRTRIIVPAALAALLALGVIAGTAAAARPRHEADHSKKKHHHAKAMAGMTAAEMAAMSATADDRGFTKLANGEQHSHGFTQPVSKADRVALAHQMELARQTALQYPT